MATGRIPTTANSPLTTKGDLFGYSTTQARVAVGSDGDTLVADSAATTGLRWQGNYAAAKNKILNGNFDHWQRGTSSAAIATGTYLADRWKLTLVGTSINATYSRDTSVPNAQSLYSAKLQQLTNNATSVTEFALWQIFEVGTVYNLLGKTTSVSFWYRSNRTGTHYARLYSTNITGGTDVATSFSVSAANTWEYKTLTFSTYAAATAITGALTDNGGGLQIGINLFGGAAGLTVSTNDYFQISQVQVESGSVATAFQTATGTLQGELAACQRYYFRNTADQVYGSMATGFATSSTGGLLFLQMPVQMRVTPTALEYANLRCLDSGFAGTLTSLSLTTNECSKTVAEIALTGTGYTTHRPIWLSANNNAAGYVAVTAEL